VLAHVILIMRVKHDLRKAQNKLADSTQSPECKLMGTGASDTVRWLRSLDHYLHDDAAGVSPLDQVLCLP
jgi:hypothetical protein